MDKLTETEKKLMQLDEEESEILEAFEEGILKKKAMSKEEIDELKLAARETLIENDRIRSFFA